jgi:hypothetical protein
VLDRFMLQLWKRYVHIGDSHSFMANLIFVLHGFS